MTDSLIQGRMSYYELGKIDDTEVVYMYSLGYLLTCRNILEIAQQSARVSEF